MKTPSSHKPPSDGNSTACVDDLYTPIDIACAEIRRRWVDRDLAQRINAYLHDDLPDILHHQPVGLSTSHVASPNFALLAFQRQARMSGLSPVVFEYLDDLFVTTNYDKASLAKMRFLIGSNGHGRLWDRRKIIDLTGSAERMPLRALRTVWDESFVDFHHRLFMSTQPDITVCDGSEWYCRNGSTASTRYFATMALFVRNAVLFENFLTSQSERQFTETVVLPAFRAIHHHFGLKPLIVRITPSGEEEDRMWWAYPGDTLKHVPEWSHVQERP